jgi:hypothetical protein
VFCINYFWHFHSEIELGDFFLSSKISPYFRKNIKKRGVNVNKLIISSSTQNVRITSKSSLSIPIRNNYTIRGHNLLVVPGHRKRLEITELTVPLTVTKHRKHIFKNNMLSY